MPATKPTEQKQDAAAKEKDDAWDVDFKGDGDTRPFHVLLMINAGKFVLILGCLYIFICTLSFLADGFRLVAGKQAGEVFRNSEIFNNEMAGCMVGLLVTVLVQSSSTSTSIVITMVASDLLTVKQAIPLIMGANMGTSVTSTIVALGQAGNRDEFRRAFAAATIHDMFNILSVTLFLPLEAATGYLYKLSLAIVESQNLTPENKPPEMLSKITKPFTKSIIEIDKKVFTNIATETNQTKLAELMAKSMIKPASKSDALLAGTSMSDEETGILVLVLSLVALCLSLVCMVKLLKSILQGKVAVWLHQSVNGEVPDIKCGGIKIYMGWLAGYLAMGAGVGLTILVQSSSITTSALTPLVGVGVITIERMYPTVLGSNIGTTVTGVLAALAADASKLQFTLQVAYCHLFFNLSGIAIWYCIWPLRAVPIGMAKLMGSIVFEYRWFAILYIAVVFFCIPAIWVGLSLAGSAAVITVSVIVGLALIFVLVVNHFQKKSPGSLPKVLRTWEFLPLWMHSLEPLDRAICAPLAQKCCKKHATPPSKEPYSSSEVEKQLAKV